MTYQVGSTVLAIREGDKETIYVYGEGVYVGDQLLPGTDGEVPDLDREAITAVLTEDDATPVEQHRFLTFWDGMAQAGISPTKTREQMIADIEADRARPMEDRIRELYLNRQTNPCIYLDSGDVVYGYQCWWGPRERFEQRMPHAEWIEVPVPEGNGRWK